MDVSGLWVDESRQGVDIGAQQFLQSSILQNLADNRVFPFQGLKHLFVCDVLPLLGLLGFRVEFECFEEHFAHLLRAAYIEVQAGQAVYLLFQSQHLLRE